MYTFDSYLKIDDVLEYTEKSISVNWEELTEKGRIRLPILSKTSVQYKTNEVLSEKEEDEGNKIV